jgi:hypothetical protein
MQYCNNAEERAGNEGLTDNLFLGGKDHNTVVVSSESKKFRKLNIYINFSYDVGFFLPIFGYLLC